MARPVRFLTNTKHTGQMDMPVLSDPSTVTTANVLSTIDGVLKVSTINPETSLVEWVPVAGYIAHTENAIGELIDTLTTAFTENP